MTCDSNALQTQIPELLAELCCQVVGIVRDLAREAPLRSLAVTGGHNLRSQSKNLSQVILNIILLSAASLYDTMSPRRHTREEPTLCSPLSPRAGRGCSCGYARTNQ